jgi:hypothetical protein
MGCPSLPNLPWERLLDDPDGQIVCLLHQRITDVGRHESPQARQRLPADHHCATLPCPRRFETIQDRLWRLDRVGKRRLHGAFRDIGRVIQEAMAWG